MFAPDDMNIVFVQTPNVEKTQQAEQQNPDQTQRHAAVKEAEEHRTRTESVQTTDDTKEIKPLDNEKQEKKQARRQKKFQAEAGNIVDVLI